MNKICRKCQIEKTVVEFSRDKNRVDGFANCCKSCVKEYQSSERVKEIKRLAQRKYAHTEKGVMSEKRHSGIRQRRIKELGRDKVYYLVRHKADKKPCEICGISPAQAHHHDYSKPLDVRWLCPIHHAAEHVEERRCG